MDFRSTSLLLGLALLNGCALVYNYGDYHGTGGAGSSGLTSAGGAGSGGRSTTGSLSMPSSTGNGTGGGCGEPGAVCAPIPKGWDGPDVLLTSSTSQPMCTSSPWTKEVESGGTTIQQPTCGSCSCDSIPSDACQGITSVTLEEYTPPNVACSGVVSTVTVTLSAPCTAVDLNAAMGTSAPPSGAKCSSGAGPMTNATFSQHATVCSGGSTGTCNGGACVATGQVVCVHQSGIQACPSSYPHPNVVYADVTQPPCGACSCSVKADACTQSVTLYPDAGCLGTGTQLTLDGTTCFDGGTTQYMGATMNDIPPPSASSCNSDGVSKPQGTAVGNGNMTTVCCSS